GRFSLYTPNLLKSRLGDPCKKLKMAMDAIHEMEDAYKNSAAIAGNTATMLEAVSKAALSTSAAHLVQIASQVAGIADDSIASKVKLVKAARRLSRIEASGRAHVVRELILESAALAREAENVGNQILRCSAIDLGNAGRSFLQLAALQNMDGLVEEQADQDNEEVPEQPTTWISSWWSKRKRMRDIESLEAPLLNPAASMVRDNTSTTVPQGQGRLCDKWLGMQTCALAMSLSLLPYMGRDGLFKDKTIFSSNYLWRVDLLFKLWWGLVALGVPCSLYGRGCMAQQYARVSGHLAILGLTFLVGMFSHWILEIEAIEAAILLKSFLGLTTAGFICLFIACC
uniref:Uncharacterized protein n=1 Tax=Aegilops tauschii subsp. strangulata TaxID=200361 RepID=A0A453M5M5_AEGTS